MIRTLNRAVVASGVIYSAGTTETPELAEQITNPDFWDGEVPEATGYASMKVPELVAEIEVRNESREDADLLSTQGKKADLIATLEADDES